MCEYSSECTQKLFTARETYPIAHTTHYQINFNNGFKQQCRNIDYKSMSKLGDLYKNLFEEYKKGKKPGIAQKEFNDLWTVAKQKYNVKEEFIKWASDLLVEYRRINQAKKSSNILYYCSASTKVSQNYSINSSS